MPRELGELLRGEQGEEVRAGLFVAGANGVREGLADGLDLGLLVIGQAEGVGEAIEGVTATSTESKPEAPGTAGSAIARRTSARWKADEPADDKFVELGLLLVGQNGEDVLAGLGAKGFDVVMRLVEDLVGRVDLLLRQVEIAADAKLKSAVERSAPEAETDKRLIGKCIADDCMNLVYKLIARDLAGVKLGLQGFDLRALVVGQLGMHAAESASTGRRSELLECVDYVADRNLV